MIKRDRAYYENSIWCYTDKLSFYPGDEVVFRVSGPEPEFSCSITRVGAHEEPVFHQTHYRCEPHPIPEKSYLVGCHWPEAFRITIPADWSSGYYRVQLFAENSSCEHFFVVKPPRGQSTADIALVLATNTYQAYNSWGGKNLYGTDSDTPEDLAQEWGGKCSPVLSWNRPFTPRLVAAEYPMRIPSLQKRGFGEGAVLPDFVTKLTKEPDFGVWDFTSGFLHRWEHAFVRWAEANGYAIDYFVQYDLDETPDCLAPYSCYASVGHDEYWSWAERDAVENYVESGGNAFFMSGNASYWQIRFDDDGRTMTCYKYDAYEHDPVVGTSEEKYLSGMWSDPIIGRPENLMMGTSFTRAGYSNTGLYASASAGGYTVYRADHWALKGTELFYGDMFGESYKLAGYETDGCAYTVIDGLPVPTGEDGTSLDFEIIAMAPATLGEPEETQLQGSLGYKDAAIVAERIYGENTRANRDKARHGQSTMGTFRKGKGEVFSAATTEWAYGLANNDPYVEKITSNVLERFLNSKNT